jgi:shikimate kinase
VVLIGPPGAGKSTVAAEVASRLGLDGDAVVDTDTMVEHAAGRTISEIFVDSGEPVFRALEREAVRQALAGEAAVVALGGGAVLDESTQADLERAASEGAAVVFLDVQITDAARRIGLNASRPLLIGNPRTQWLTLMAARRPVYERLATATVATDDREPGEVADLVLAAVSGAHR